MTDQQLRKANEVRKEVKDIKEKLKILEGGIEENRAFWIREGAAFPSIATATQNVLSRVRSSLLSEIEAAEKRFSEI